jgi:hypothetical protein
MNFDFEFEVKFELEGSLQNKEKKNEKKRIRGAVSARPLQGPRPSRPATCLLWRFLNSSS